MSGPSDSPRLTDSYTAYRGSAEDESAYAQMMASIAQPPGAPAAAAAEATPAAAPAAAAAPARGAPNEEMIQAEMQRLSAEPFDKSKYANPEEALRQRALENLGGEPPRPTAGERAISVAKDIGRGLTLELPRALYSGVHGAVHETLNTLSDTATSLDLTKWGMGAIDWSVSHEADKGLLEGWKVLSGEERDALHAAGRDFKLGEAVPLKPGDPKTVTGSLIKGVAQFTTGMAIGGREMEAVGLPTNLAGWAGRGVTAAKGFLSMFESFDGAQHRLSDLIQQVPSLRNPVTEFLESKPGDNAIEGRLKNAIEGTVIGQAADGLLAGLRMLRGAYTARGAAQALVDHAASAPPPPDSAGLEALGKVTTEAERKEAIAQIDLAKFGLPAREQLANAEEAKRAAAGAAVEREGMTPEEVAGLRAPAEEPAISVNFARIDGPDDIKNAMQGLADKFKDDIDLARRGVQTFADTKLGADATDAWKTLMERRVGEPLNAEQGLAARQLWASSAAKTMELADIATRAPTVENLFAFRRMLTTHAAIQQEVLAARTETARALGAWRIPAGDDPLRLESMVHQLSGDAGLKGGAETALELARRVSQLAGSQEWEALSHVAEKGAFARTRDAVLEAWTNGLLTSPLTHVKVTASNAATAVLRIAERATASKLDEALGNTNGVATGEAAAQVAGLVGGFKDAFRFAGKLARSVWQEDPFEGGQDFKLPELGTDPLSNAVKAARTGQYSLKPFGEPEYMQNQGAISAATFGMADSGWVGNGIDLLGQIVRSPGRALTAEHDFFRSIGYRMELNALATRQAVADVNAGRITQDALGSRVSELIENPPPQLHMDAVNGTLYQTFTDAPGQLAQKIGELRNDYPLLRVILPFYKIPSRILSFTFERTPLAPLMSTFQQNVAAGGARQSLALAQVGLGTAAMLATADAVLSGHITGSGPQEKGTRAVLENEGWQPYSVKSGDRWLQYNRIEPAGSAMAMAADAVEAMQNFHAGVNGDDPDTANLALATVASIANDITSKSYLQGLANFFETIADPKSNAKRALESLAGSVVPAGVASLDRVTDPYKREVYRMIDAIRARTPGWSEGLPPMRNLWGEPVPNGSGKGAAFDLFSPLGTRSAANEPIDAELLRQQIDLPRVPSRTALNGITLDLNRVDPKIYSRFQELAGNAYKGPDGFGLKDALNALVTGQHTLSPTYQRLTDGPDGTKADMIRDVVSEYRNGAKGQLLEEYPQLADMVHEGIQAKQFLKTGGTP